jgi:hypothetical protein
MFSSLSDVSARSRPRLLVTSAVALVLILLPVGIADGPFLHGKTALAKSDNAGGNGKGHGKGRGGGHGLDGDDELLHRGRGQGHGRGAGGPHDLNEFLDGVRSGKAFGIERRDPRMAAAKERYQGALGKRDHAGPEEETVAYGFTSEETVGLIERGWKGRTAGEDGFRSHGERTRTMVELSKQLGYGARVGAMQANFGTPQENGITELQAELAAAEDPAEVERLEAELAAAIEQAKPGNGPDDGWPTVDLDVNDDQVVDQRDLEAARQSTGDGDEEPPADDGEQLAENNG